MEGGGVPGKGVTVASAAGIAGPAQGDVGRGVVETVAVVAVAFGALAEGLADEAALEGAWLAHEGGGVQEVAQVCIADGAGS